MTKFWLGNSEWECLSRVDNNAEAREDLAGCTPMVEPLLGETPASFIIEAGSHRLIAVGSSQGIL